MSNPNNKTDNLKTAQFYRALYDTYLDKDYCKAILRKNGYVNSRLPHSKSLQKNSFLDLRGSTLLHVAFECIDGNILADILLSEGADYTLKDHRGLDVLQLSIRLLEKRYQEPYDFRGRSEIWLIDRLLNIHVNSGNISNPCDPNGFTYLHAACMAKNTRAIEFLLKNGALVNQTINENSALIPGYSPLHISAQCSHLEAVELLLSHGAEVSLKDVRGMTALHILLRDNLNINDSHRHTNTLDKPRALIDVETNEKIMECLLGSYPDIVKRTGIAPIHVITAMRDTSKLRNYLENNNVDVNLSVTENSSQWIGFTALHFAMLFNFQNVELLAKKLADFTKTDVEGITPLDIYLRRYDIENQHFIPLAWKNIVLFDGGIRLIDFLLALSDLDTFKWFLDTKVSDINVQIPMESSLWPGYTFLHVLLQIYRDINERRDKSRLQLYRRMIAVCVVKGADINRKNASFVTAFDQAIQFNQIEIIHMLFQNIQSITHNHASQINGLSYLHVASAITNHHILNKLLSCNSNVNVNVALTSSVVNFFNSKCSIRVWPTGTTALHIAVVTGNVSTVKQLLKRNADVHAKDCNEMTPIHWLLLCSSNRDELTNLLFSMCDLAKDRSVSKGGLNYLHVASCSNNGAKFIDKLIDADAEIDSRISSSSNENNKSDQLEFLSRYSGYTALHLALEHNNSTAALLLIQRGADVVSCYRSFVYGRKMYPLYEVMDVYCQYWNQEMLDNLVSRFLRDDLVAERVFREIGLTRLHFFCRQVDIISVKDCLDAGADVNARIHQDSPLWPGCTALHVLLKTSDRTNVYEEQHQQDVGYLMDILLENGADVTLTNADSDTVIHLADRTFRSYGRNHSTPTVIRHNRLNILLDQLKDFTVNHTNDDGVSHFHVACSANHLSVIRNFLSNGVDVNEATDYFFNELPGYSPLHLALNSSSKSTSGIDNQLQTIDLLLKHGAEVNVEDSDGEYPIHRVAESVTPRVSLFEILIRTGANIHAIDVRARTAFEILLMSKTNVTEDIELFLTHGFPVFMTNSISKKGYLATSLYNNEHGIVQTSNFLAMIAGINAAETDVDGRTAIHNVVSIRESIGTYDYANVIETLISRGWDVNRRDNLGKTALHVATDFRNDCAVSGLLKTGIDIHICDLNGKSAFDYIFDTSKIVRDNRCHDDALNDIMAVLFVHVYKLLSFKHYAKQTNKSAMKTLMANYPCNYLLQRCKQRLDDEIERTKSTIIDGSTCKLYDFLTETGAVAAFPTTTMFERQAVKKFFEDTHRYELYRQFPETVGLLKLQYRKALERLDLMQPAKDALQFVLNFSFPELCSEAILRLLTNRELNNLINAAPETENL